MAHVGILGKAPATGGSFVPTDIAGLAGWWDASDAATFTFSSGVLVSQWNDKSGNSRHFVQADTTKQPSRNGTQNSLTTVTFDGGNDTLATSSFTLAQPLTAIYACDRSSQARGSLSSVGGGLQLGYGSTRYYAGSSEVTAFATVGTAQQLSFVINGASSAAWRDGVAGTTGNPGSSGTTTGLRIGERNLADHFLGEMFEICVYSGALSTVNRQACEAYLKAKWGTP